MVKACLSVSYNIVINLQIQRAEGSNMDCEIQRRKSWWKQMPHMKPFHTLQGLINNVSQRERFENLLRPIWNIYSSLNVISLFNCMWIYLHLFIFVVLCNSHAPLSFKIFFNNAKRTEPTTTHLFTHGLECDRCYSAILIFLKYKQLNFSNNFCP